MSIRIFNIKRVSPCSDLSLWWLGAYAGDLDLIEKAGLGTTKKNITKIERMLKALIKSLENKPLKL